MHRLDAGPYAGRMSNPTTTRRLAILRLALRLTAGLFSTTAFTYEHRPIAGDAYGQLAWLRAQLTPLARHDRLIRELVAMLDPERAVRRWASPHTAKRELLRLAERAQALGAVKRKVRR